MTGLGTALVFGASAGIGQATARRLAGRFRVVGASRRGRCDVAGVLPVVCDLRRYDQVAAAFAAAGPDVACVVNCVGVGFYAPLEGDYTAEWREMLEANVLGLLNVISNLLRSAPACRHFVQVGSLAAYRPSRTPGNLVYGASKAAALPIMAELRRSLRAAGNPMKVTLVSPGFVGGTDFSTGFFRAAPDQARDILATGFPSLTADQVAAAIDDTLQADTNIDVGEVVLRPVGQPD